MLTPTTVLPLPRLQRPATTPLELARRAANGNAPATGRLLRAVGPKVDGAVRAVLGAHHPDREDVIQLALLSFVRALPAYRGECDPVGYARAIAVRTAIATRKRERARAQRSSEVDLERIASPSPSPGEASDESARRELLANLVAELPEEQSEALVLRVVFGWSMEEIARETEAPLNTVRSRLRLAKERLRGRIENDARLSAVLDRL